MVNLGNRNRNETEKADLFKAQILFHFYKREFREERRDDFRRMGSIKEGSIMKGSGEMERALFY